MLQYRQYTYQVFQMNVKSIATQRSRTLLTIGIGGGGFHALPIRVCAAQRGRDFEAPDLERGIHFGGVF